jgi:hypothetical protein
MTNLRKTLTVIGPHGSEVTVLKPGLGKVIVIAQGGATVRGMRFYHPTLLNVSTITPASSLGRARSPSPPSSADPIRTRIFSKSFLECPCMTG